MKKAFMQRVHACMCTNNGNSNHSNVPSNHGDDREQYSEICFVM